MTYRLRQLRDSEDAALLAIHIAAIMAVSDAYYSLAERESWAYGLTARNYALSRSAGETFAIAVDQDDAPIGFCSWNSEQIISLYVAADQQGRGIGTALLQHGETALGEFGVSISRIHSSLPAVKFYQANGYAITGHTNHASRGGLPMAGILLEKALPR